MSVCVCCVCLCFLSGKRTKCHKSVTMCRKVPHSPLSPPQKGCRGRQSWLFTTLCWMLGCVFYDFHVPHSTQSAEVATICKVIPDEPKLWLTSARREGGKESQRCYSAVAGGLISSVRKVADKGSGLAWADSLLLCDAFMCDMPSRQTGRRTDLAYVYIMRYKHISVYSLYKYFIMATRGVCLLIFQLSN